MSFAYEHVDYLHTLSRELEEMEKRMSVVVTELSGEIEELKRRVKNDKVFKTDV
jgi:hypothetical protein